MLCGVLRMPPELWLDNEIARFQVLARMREAADELEKRAAEIERLRRERNLFEAMWLEAEKETGATEAALARREGERTT